ncbi:hypothetical protein Pmani_010587 [Petrolisthes manimaculis]|uniref:Uncharacterized protein n=1 Tax=Petrolisthes manimaculis TaxID=1843537 RepID=A0AAE1Q1E6_9EUCA|nr:hypothetical protein Pmani_010587 [Petrolisthes manimaculis]
MGCKEGGSEGGLQGGKEGGNTPEPSQEDYREGCLLVLPLHTGVETEGKDDSQTSSTKPFLPKGSSTSPIPHLTCRSHRALSYPQYSSSPV